MREKMSCDWAGQAAQDGRQYSGPAVEWVLWESESAGQIMLDQAFTLLVPELERLTNRHGAFPTVLRKVAKSW